MLSGDTLLRPLVDYINRRPMNPSETEALYRVHVVCRPGGTSDVRDLLFEELERHNYPIRDIETLSEGEDTVGLAAVLAPSTADPAELDKIIHHLESHDVVQSATWTVSAEG